MRPILVATAMWHVGPPEDNYLPLPGWAPVNELISGSDELRGGEDPPNAHVCKIQNEQKRA